MRLQSSPTIDHVGMVAKSIVAKSLARPLVRPCTKLGEIEQIIMSRGGMSPEFFDRSTLCSRHRIRRRVVNF